MPSSCPISCELAATIFDNLISCRPVQATKTDCAFNIIYHLPKPLLVIGIVGGHFLVPSKMFNTPDQSRCLCSTNNILCPRHLSISAILQWRQEAAIPRAGEIRKGPSPRRGMAQIVQLASTYCRRIYGTSRRSACHTQTKICAEVPRWIDRSFQVDGNGRAIRAISFGSLSPRALSSVALPVFRTALVQPLALGFLDPLARAAAVFVALRARAASMSNIMPLTASSIRR